MEISQKDDPNVEKILTVAKNNINGIRDKDIKAAFPELTAAEVVSAINKLLQKGLFDILNQGGSLIYRLKTPTNNEAIKGADNEEKVVYSLIEEAGNKGIWIKDIRTSSNLHVNKLRKILKNLESKKVIKGVKCVNAMKKKVYMLYDLEPERSLLGGAWYQDQDFESEFVDVLNRQCLRFLQERADKIRNNPQGPMIGRSQSMASANEVLKYITDLGISNVTLEVDDLISILNTLIYDGKVEETLCPDGSRMYRAIEPLIPPSDILQVPCGGCPLVEICHPDGHITPQTCKYLDEWF